MQLVLSVISARACRLARSSRSAVPRGPRVFAKASCCRIGELDAMRAPPPSAGVWGMHLLPQRRRWQAAGLCSANNAALELQKQAWQGAMGAAAAAAVDANGGGALQCTVRSLAPDLADALSDALLDNGAASAAVSENRQDGVAEQQLYAENVRQLWDSCTLTAHFDANADAEAALTAAAAQIGLDPPPACIVEAVAGADWQQTVLASYQPLCIVPDAGGGSLWVTPSWAAPPVEHGAVSIVMEPGIAFGTGEHPTTRLCLGWLWDRRAQLQGCSVMDYGAGSGVLAVGALRLGAASAVATDVDPCATAAASRNADLNGAGDRLVSLLCERDLEAPEPLAAAELPAQRRAFDVVVANILAGPLVGLAPRLAGYARPSAALALSGVLAGDQAAEVVAAYAELFDDVSVAAEHGGWALITGIGRAAAE